MPTEIFDDLDLREEAGRGDNEGPMPSTVGATQVCGTRAHTTVCTDSCCTTC